MNNNNSNRKNHENRNHNKHKKNQTKRIDWSKVDFKEYLPFIIGIVIIVGLLAGTGVAISKVITVNKQITTNQSANGYEADSETNVATTSDTTETAKETEPSMPETTESAIETSTQPSAKTTIAVTKEAKTIVATEAALPATEVTTSSPTEAITEIVTEATTVAVTETTTIAPTTALPHYIAFLGDSITCGYYTDLVYTDVVCSALDANKLSYGISGSTIASDCGQGFVDRYKSIYSGANLIVVYGGSNDYYSNVPLGTSESTDKNTFYGALSALCSGLKSNYPKAKIVFLTPLPGQFEGKYNSGNNDAGYSIYDYVNAIKATCSQYNCSVFNSFADTEITNNNFEDYTVDGLHPNETGHRVLGNALTKYIKKLYS